MEVVNICKTHLRLDFFLFWGLGYSSCLLIEQTYVNPQKHRSKGIHLQGWDSYHQGGLRGRAASFGPYFKALVTEPTFCLTASSLNLNRLLPDARASSLSGAVAPDFTSPKPSRSPFVYMPHLPFPM